jgi:hypothetical protein
MIPQHMRFVTHTEKKHKNFLIAKEQSDYDGMNLNYKRTAPEYDNFSLWSTHCNRPSINSGV